MIPVQESLIKLLFNIKEMNIFYISYKRSEIEVMRSAYNSLNER